MVAGFINPVEYSFDGELYDQGIFTLKHKLPYSDLDSISKEERIRLYGDDEVLEFSHTLDDLIGGQIEAGFHVIGFYEDYWDEGKIKEYMPSFIATRAFKPLNNR